MQLGSEQKPSSGTKESDGILFFRMFTSVDMMFASSHFTSAELQVVDPNAELYYGLPESGNLAGPILTQRTQYAL